MTRFAIFTAQEGPELGNMCVASVRHHHPDAEIVHISDRYSPALEGVDAVWRRPWDRHLNEPIMGFRLRCLEELLDDEPTVLLDSDVLVHRNVDSVFALDFDVALTRRRKGKEHIPFNAGVMFSRCAAFFDELAKESMAFDHRDFMVIEHTLPRMVATGHWSILELPDSEWNCSEVSERGFPEEARIVHYKGLRKSCMPDHFNQGVWR